MQHEEEGFSCAVEGLTGSQSVREEGSKDLTDSRPRGRVRSRSHKKTKHSTGFMVHRTAFYLVECVFDDNQHRRVRGAQFSVQRLEAGAVTRRAVGQLPREAHRPGGQLLTQLVHDNKRGREKRCHLNQQDNVNNAICSHKNTFSCEIFHLSRTKLTFETSDVKFDTTHFPKNTMLTFSG